ncbi:MAG: hypothetical protein K9L17_08215 [Clostridiales bacterium]|nr:hypothetical protein [Clostridiales bacterium]MCF8022659.1 hypothetical protein [Clostridiales bacterium]
MSRKKILTENDITLLRTIYKCDVASLEQAKRIYGNTKSYYYHRTNELQRRSLITKYGKYIELTRTGLRALGCDENPVKNRYQKVRELKSKKADLYLTLDNWEFSSSREIKRLTSMVDSNLINCYIKRKNGYAVYFLMDKPQKKKVSKIKSELKNLHLYGISGAVVFCPNKEAKQLFGELSEKPKELLILPYPYGMKLLKYAAQVENYLHGMFPDFDFCPRPFADLEKGSVFISNLVYNDITKIEQLNNYLKKARREEGREVKIACLESQSKSLSRLNLEQVIIPEPERLCGTYAVGS